MLLKYPDKLRNQVLNQFSEFAAFHKKGDGSESPKPDQKIESAQTPEEQFTSAYRVLHDTLANDVLEAAKQASPEFFENLVVDLLVAIGYGGSRSDAGEAVGHSGDGGIDGIIKEDKLGLDTIYIQAKRWKDGVVSRPVVQAFAGSLDGVKARKGVLITTSTFTQDALKYVEKIEKKIVLIDGRQLADLMIEYNIGVTAVQPSQAFMLKRLDEDYFEEVV
ncbi:MAG: restriction endonuclease [Bryobacteraceae bacterium]